MRNLLFLVHLRAINSAVECYLHTVEVRGSSPLSPTKFSGNLRIPKFGSVFKMVQKGAAQRYRRPLSPPAYSGGVTSVTFSPALLLTLSAPVPHNALVTTGNRVRSPSCLTFER